MLVSKYFSFGRRILSFCVSHSSPSCGMSAFRRVKASGLPPSFHGRYSILKSKPLQTSLHRICRPVNSLVVINPIKFWWSVKTQNCCPLPLGYPLHSLSTLTIANSSLSCQSYMHSAGFIVFDRYPIGFHFPSSSY